MIEKFRPVTMTAVFAGIAIAAGAGEFSPAHSQQHATSKKARKTDPSATSGYNLVKTQADRTAANKEVAAAMIAQLDDDSPAARERVIQAQIKLDRANAAADRALCSNRDAFASRMRTASIQEQNYLKSLCGR